MTTPEQEPWLLDANVLVALSLNTHIHHHAAHRALREHAGPWATSVSTETSLVRLLMNPAVTGRAFTGAQVLAVMTGFRQDSRHRFLGETTSLTEAIIDVSVLMGHRQVTDLHLVNLAAFTGCVLATFDARILASLHPADRRHVLVLPQ